MKHLNVFLITFTLITILFVVDKVEAIVGGKVAKLGEFKYQVSLQSGNRHICGGVIVGEQHVISAAHCFINENDQFKNEIYTVVGGIINLKSQASKGIVGIVDKIYVPKEFKFKTKQHPKSHFSTGDIAVLKLESKLILGKNSPLDKVHVPQLNTKVKYVNKKVFLSGFGVESRVSHIDKLQGIKEFGVNRCNKMKYAECTVMHKRSCEFEYANFNDNHLCARVILNVDHNSSNPEGACDGDTGGPLVVPYEETLIGILMHPSNDCNELHRSALYTRVSSFVPFINQAMSDEVTRDIRSAVYRRKFTASGAYNGEKEILELFQLL